MWHDRLLHRHLLLPLACLVTACEQHRPPLETSAPASSSAPPLPPTCAERLRDAGELPQAGLADPVERANVLGRARGEPVVFTRLPTTTPGSLAEKRRKARTKEALRDAVLAEGYLHAADPRDTLALATDLVLRDLFDEPKLFLQRGERTLTLTRREQKGGHVYDDEAGRRAELLALDRVSTTELGEPLHVDLWAAARRAGLTRLRDVRVGPRFASAVTLGGGRALFRRDGARLDLECIDGDAGEDRAANEARLSSVDKLRAAVELSIDEEHPFDRPRDEKTAEKDGHLRPLWNEAYRRGAPSFSGEGGAYPVFDAKGRPAPPEVCVEFILDTIERASGGWYRPLGEPPGRTPGTVDFDALGIANRRGVLGFEAWAGKSGHYDAVRFAPERRIPFGRRDAFFQALARGDDVAPGDIVAIQGEKRDGLVHQHAILVLRVDPLSGFPFDLADQMKRPRRRTWEGIMAEAPKRSLLYRLRPRAAVMP